MSNLATALKDEMKRLTRKEIKTLTTILRRSSAQHRRDIASLKRTVAQLESKIVLLEKKTWSSSPLAAAKVDEAEKVRFSAKGLASQRDRLNLSVADYATLIGVSVPTLYNWENGRTRPRTAQLLNIAAMRGITKKEARARLDQLA